MTEHRSSTPLTATRITVFWVPLAMTWLMMAVEGPLLTAVIARMADPKLNLAAFGIAFAFALIAEAPVIMMMTASTALVVDRDSYLKLHRFTNLINAAITATMVIGLVPPVHHWVSSTLLGLTPEVAGLTWLPLALLVPWPAAIGFRRFYQGILIRTNQTRRVAVGTVIRLLTMGLAATVVGLGTELHGAAVGAAALSCGVIAEGISARILAAKAIRRLKEDPAPPIESSAEPLTAGFLVRFYIPLALTSFLSLGVQPVVTFFVGHGRAPLESLAVLPVVHALVFIFRALGLAFQETAIALFGDDMEGYRPLRRFTQILMASVLGALALVVWTPLGVWWFHSVAGLTSELVPFALEAARIMTIMPALTVWISWQRAQLVHFKRTSAITWASGLEIIGVISGLFLFIVIGDLVGATAAALALVLGRLAANASLTRPIRRLHA